MVDLTESFKNQSKDYGLDMMDSKKPLAVFTQGKSIIKAVLQENPLASPWMDSSHRKLECGKSEGPVVTT